MDKHLTYLLINFFTLFFPVVLSFDKRVRFIKNWRHIFPGLIITGGLFLFWDYLFTIYDVWSFNPEYVIGLYILNLPLEEILFFVTVPFACLFIYECLNYYVKRDVLKAASTSITLVLLVLSIAMLIFFSGRVYTLITFGLLLALCIYLLLKRPPYMGRFYLAYLVSLAPFYVVNGILTSIPIVLYNDAENLGFRVGTIPFEDHFYSLAMLLLNVIFFEFFKQKSQSA
ncbi:lycopene cyclase domain-containing protein [Paradesertivirga mongoliensis]|uniref:Lycopene cyclase domain-containing protein n=1 Tax=Paradesertivirga mongoliensis TaxID=2100740 RepID=A0ABW4ZJH4_9SPHI|nr:lycopene cyclase domain-containing protein [Pedobacter mongoliensis]